MPLSFLNPALLFGAFAAAVPVILHFLSRRRARQIAFSDLRFLAAAESQQSRRRGIRRWLLLLLRVLAVLCVALALARPHWGALGHGAGGSRTVLILLDASASMQAQTDDGRSRFEVAREVAGNLAAELPPQATIQVICVAAAAEPLFAAWLPGGEGTRGAIERAAVTDGRFDLAAGLREAARQIAIAPATPVEVVLISDLQAADWPDLDAAVAQVVAIGEARLLVHRVGDETPGGAVLEVTLPARALRPGESARLTAAVRPEREGQPFWLELGGRRVGESIAPAPRADGGSVALEFAVAVPGPGRYPGLVRKETDRFAADDARPFVLEVPERLEVLLVHGDDRDQLGRGGWRYLERALVAEGDDGGPFGVRAVTPGQFHEGDLELVDLLVLVDTGPLGRRLQEAVSGWLSGGGALLALAGDPTQSRFLTESLLPLMNLPGEASFVTREPVDAERAVAVDADHPVLADLGEDAIATLREATWRRYHRVSDAGARVLLAASTGAPLLLEGEVGEGRWALLPFDLQPETTDLALNPVFLPLVQRLAATLAWVGPGHESGASTVGEPVTARLRPDRLRIGAGTDAAEIRVIDPRGATSPAVLTWQGPVPVLATRPTSLAGVYTFVAGNDTLAQAAAAVPASESSPYGLAGDQFVERLAAAGWRETADLAAASAADLERALSGRDLSSWLLVSALLLLAAELYVGRRV